MTKQFKHIRALLEIERKRLTEELELKVIPSAAEGHATRDETATECFELEKRLALTQHIREQLADMEYALGKLAKGTYGLCDFCCNSIPFARLEAITQAILCLDCKVLQGKNAKTRWSKNS